jgi:hypothetical protein
MILEPGDVVLSRGEYASFQVLFHATGRWWPCHFDFKNAFLVLDVELFEDRQSARLLPLDNDGCDDWWFSGSFEDWCTLDKLS